MPIESSKESSGAAGRIASFGGTQSTRSGEAQRLKISGRDQGRSGGTGGSEERTSFIGRSNGWGKGGVSGSSAHGTSGEVEDPQKPGFRMALRTKLHRAPTGSDGPGERYPMPTGHRSFQNHHSEIGQLLFGAMTFFILFPAPAGTGIITAYLLFLSHRRRLLPECPVSHRDASPESRRR